MTRQMRTNHGRQKLKNNEIAMLMKENYIKISKIIPR